jgi:hypothetical protein
MDEGSVAASETSDVVVQALLTYLATILPPVRANRLLSDHRSGGC